MLIRLCGHYIDNPNHIDKLISIMGLPEEWLFRTTKNGKEIALPWEPDVEANIPQSIRHLCEIVEVTKVFPPIEKGRDPVVDRFTIIGLRFNFLTQPGQELWEKIERYLDRMTPRDEKVPKPVLVAPNQQSQFDPHLARRSTRGSLELQKTEIPHVDLRSRPPEFLAPQPPVAPPAFLQPTTTTANAPATVTLTHAATEPPAAPEAPAKTTGFACLQCPRVFTQQQHLKMHQTKHAKEAREAAKAKVAAGV